MLVVQWGGGGHVLFALILWACVYQSIRIWKRTLRLSSRLFINTSFSILRGRNAPILNEEHLFHKLLWSYLRFRDSVSKEKSKYWRKVGISWWVFQTRLFHIASKVLKSKWWQCCKGKKGMMAAHRFGGPWCKRAIILSCVTQCVYFFHHSPAGFIFWWNLDPTLHCISLILSRTPPYGAWG